MTSSVSSDAVGEEATLRGRLMAEGPLGLVARAPEMTGASTPAGRRNPFEGADALYGAAFLALSAIYISCRRCEPWRDTPCETSFRELLGAAGTCVGDRGTTAGRFCEIRLFNTC